MGDNIILHENEAKSSSSQSVYSLQFSFSISDTGWLQIEFIAYFLLDYQARQYSKIIK